MLICSRSSVGQKSVLKSIKIVVPILLVLSAASLANAQQTSTPSGGTPEQTLPPAPAQGSKPDSSGAAPLRVMVGKSLLINTSDRIKRISVTDPEIADPQPVSPTQILVHGRSAGEVSLLIWDELERSRSFDLRVDVDVSAATEEMNRVFPDERITVSPSRSAIVLSGHVSTEDAAKRAGMIAAAYSKNVVNVLTFGPVGAQEVLLEVKFAEVDRTAVTQLGINLFAPGVGNTVLMSQTGQFGSLSVSTTGQTTTTSPDGTTTTSTATTPPRVTITDFLNFFVARQDVNVGAVIKALQQKNLLQILAEPNLIAVNGKEASFLAGGEFPFPVVQPAGGTSTVTVQFRQFGVQLKFTPLITPNGSIHLKVAPEVSTLDFANGVTIANSTIPALSTRRAETEFELQDGQSFVIAGLMDNRVTKLMSKIPGLGDIPILGNFFKSKNLQKSNAELMVLCTVHRVAASNQAPEGPKAPVPYLNKDQFDGTKAKPPGDKK